MTLNSQLDPLSLSFIFVALECSLAEGAGENSGSDAIFTVASFNYLMVEFFVKTNFL
jgi:hypothetical protein